MKKLFKLLLIALVAVVSTSCQEESEFPFEVFRINKGQHFSTRRVSALQTKGIQFQAMFDETAIYQSQTWENQYDINKLMGFSDANSMHHTNSARFGWRWADNQLEIFAYVYANGERTVMEKLGTVQLNQTENYILAIDGDSYVFTLGENPPVRFKRGNTAKIGAHYMLYPYFGGDEPAPHDINIMIRMIW